MKFKRPSQSYLRSYLTVTLVCMLAVLVAFVSTSSSASSKRRVKAVELQPLAAQARRVAEALELLGEPLSGTDMRALELAVEDRDEARGAEAIERVLDRRALVNVTISPESRVSVTRGAARAQLVERGWRVFLVKVRNDAGVTAQLRGDARVVAHLDEEDAPAPFN